MREIDIGLELPPLADLKRLYNIDRIFKVLSDDINKCYQVLPKEKGKRSFIYAEIELPEPKNKKGMLGELVNEFFKKAVKVRPYSYKREEKEFNKYICGAEKGCPDDLITCLKSVLDHDRIHYLPFIWFRCGTVIESRVEKSVIKQVKPLEQKMFVREKPVLPFNTKEEFVPYYETIAPVMAHKIPFEIFKNTNLAIKKLGKNSVRTVRTRADKDIRIFRPEDVPTQIIELANSGAFDFYIESNKCWREITDCKNCNEFCYPNLVLDIDPGKAVSREKLIDFLQILQRRLYEYKLHYLVKGTGKRGFNICALLDGFKLPEPYKYIPINVLKKRKEMSRKRMRQEIESLANNPFVVAQDFVRLLVEDLKYSYNLDYLCHDLSSNAGSPDTIKLDPSAVKRRAYTRLPFSLTDEKKVCLLICNEEENITKELIKKFDEISKDPEKVKKMCDELPQFPFKFNDSSFVRDFIEDNERKIAERQFKECLERLQI
jgi:hypothetical protein